MEKIVCEHCTKIVKLKQLSQHKKSKKCLDSRNINTILTNIENTTITEEYVLSFLTNVTKAKLIKNGTYTEDQLALLQLIL